jgi:hypothetical protein
MKKDGKWWSNATSKVIGGSDSRLRRWVETGQPTAVTPSHGTWTSGPKRKTGNDMPA